MNPFLSAVALAIPGLTNPATTMDRQILGAEPGALRGRSGMVVTTERPQADLGQDVLVVEVGDERRLFRNGMSDQPVARAATLEQRPAR